MLTISPDSYIRLTLAELSAIRLTHLVSGMDEDMPPLAGESAAATTISGYTEWVSDTEPVVSLGWDWVMEVAGGAVRMVRLGEPRSNCMLVDENNGDLGTSRTDAALAALVDALAWQAAAREHVAARYRH